MIGRLPGRPGCPGCGTVLNGYSGDGKPGPGDAALCSECGTVSVYAVNPVTGHYSLETAAELDDGGPLTLPCGCIVDTVGEAFVMQPCRPDCPNFRYALAESARQGKPVRTIEDPEFER